MYNDFIMTLILLLLACISAPITAQIWMRMLISEEHLDQNLKPCTIDESDDEH